MAVEERDPHTGYTTTGHEWNGITELNRPVPTVIWLFLAATVVFSAVYWVLMPAWPLVVTYTRGVLGHDQRDRVARDLQAAIASRETWTRQIETLGYDEIRSDDNLMEIVRRSGRTMYEDNCAACHGIHAQGGNGFPRLTGDSWLWGGDPETLAETLRVGINSTHANTRVSQMLAFGRNGVLNRDAIRDVVSFVLSLSGAASEEGADAAAVSRGAEIFAANCSACHGERGTGKTEVGAPDLTDGFWMYGGDRQSLYTTIYGGRQGHMPHWEDRLSALERKILVLYILDLGAAEQ